MKHPNWTRDELILAFNLYCKIPFGQYHHNNPQVIQLSNIIDRSPGAVAMKLVNFASLDPYHQERGIKGLSNVSKADREIWEEFTSDWNRLVEESETKLSELAGIDVTDSISEDEIIFPDGPTEMHQLVTVRLGQRFFRTTILANYRSRCCICEIPISSLLIASHIVPWAEDEKLRLNPTNGLCLCALHDKAFDRGLITIDMNYNVLISSEISHYLPQEALENGFASYHKQKIILPDKFLPDTNLLQRHTQTYFRA